MQNPNKSEYLITIRSENRIFNKNEFFFRTYFCFFIAGLAFPKDPVDPPPTGPREHVEAEMCAAAASASDAPLARAAMKPARSMTRELANITKDTGR